MLACGKVTSVKPVDLQTGPSLIEGERVVDIHHDELSVADHIREERDKQEEAEESEETMEDGQRGQ